MNVQLYRHDKLKMHSFFICNISTNNTVRIGFSEYTRFASTFGGPLGRVFNNADFITERFKNHPDHRYVWFQVCMGHI